MNGKETAYLLRKVKRLRIALDHEYDRDKSDYLEQLLYDTLLELQYPNIEKLMGIA